MSKGKQWWPLQASVDEARDAITEFQQRLRDRQWVKKHERPALLHVYATDTVWPTEQLETVNDYMQFSTHDSAVKNQGRVSILRLLCMLLKWHVALRPDNPLSTPPAVFVTPNLNGHGYSYGLIVTLQPSARYSNAKPLTLVVSERDVLTEGGMFSGRHWKVPQGADSFRWMTVRTWTELKKKASFGKWVYGSHTERRAWLEGPMDASERSERGLIVWPGAYADATGRALGAFYVSSLSSWVLPEFWDSEAVAEWISEAQKNAPIDKRPPVYRAARAAAAAAGASGEGPAALEE